MAENATPIVLYGGPIQEATRSGDLDRMRQMESTAQQYLDSVEDVKSALDELRGEIRRRSNS